MNFVIAILSVVAAVASVFAGLNSEQPASTIWFIGAGIWSANAVVQFIFGLADL